MKAKRSPDKDTWTLHNFEAKFKVGDKVRVVSKEPWACDWPHHVSYVVVGAVLEYQDGGVNIDFDSRQITAGPWMNYSLASIGDLLAGHAPADGFRDADLEAVK